MRAIKYNEAYISFLNNGTTFQKESIRKEKIELNMKVFSILYLLVIAIITLFMILEVKHEYNIDIFPNFNTPFEDVYFSVKKAF